jgi:two-component system phosphate regulon response regulator PhoB
MARIVVIEDEADLRGVLEYNLQRGGHDVQSAGTGAEGVRMVEESLPDLVLLDLILPDLSGVDVCRTLKDKLSTAPIPIMMLTARGTEQDRVTGFEAGAADYLVKPFSLRELLLRIDVVLGRGVHRGSCDGVGRMRVDRHAHRAWVDGAECSLTALEFRLLVALFDGRGRVQTRAELLRDVWGLDGDAVTRTVDTHVKRLRGKLGPAGTYVETVRGVGYRFAGR